MSIAFDTAEGERAAGDDPPKPPPGRVARKFFKLARGFWNGATKRRAWLLVGGVLTFVVANLLAALGVNPWNRFFFDAIEHKEVGSVFVGVGIIVALALASAAASVGLVHMRMRLALRWRQWITARLIERWLAERRFYQLNIIGGEGSNPEYRIADDVRLATEPLVDFLVGVTNAVLAAAAFIGILWAVGGSLRVTAFGSDFVIPGYMVLAAVVYSTITSLGMYFIGRPLVVAVEAKNAGEARLRYELTRVRDSAENIALIGGDEDERARLGELSDVLDNLDATIGRHGSSSTVVLGDSPDDSLCICDLSLTQQNGKLMIEDADVVIAPGEKVLVKGESGTGKSTLIRAMAGLWPWGSGQILRPKGAAFAFMPQRPYLPLGTLRHALLYPAEDEGQPDEALAEALRRCGLAHLVPRLHEEDQWEGILSGGEKQRLAFARLLVSPPDIIIMDESTAALDEESQARMLDFLRTDLAPAMVLCVAHRPGLEEYFDRELKLVRLEEAGPAKAQHRRLPRFRNLLKRLRGNAPANVSVPAPTVAAAPAREPVPTSEEGAGAAARERAGA